jgi:light-regulated signal transduction histidine kinase (bacteriophytochrome)
MQLEKEIDERKAMEEEREALIRELERKNGELERFTYTVSHDLKSPLIAIQGFAGLLEEDVKSGDTSRIKQDIERIIPAADLMQELLEDLLALSRIGRVANPPQDVSLDTIVSEDFLVIPVIEREAMFEIDPGLPVVHVDPDRIRELYVNLIENAIKFTRPPDHPWIRIGKREDNGETVFFVQDQGIGVDPQYSSKIFRLFEKLDGQSGGTGIGLSLVERIITCHGGRVWVESEGSGKGTSICFTLPQASGEGIE